MSDLDGPRALFAAQRPLLARQRTAIALMGLGVGLLRIVVASSDL